MPRTPKARATTRSAITHPTYCFAEFVGAEIVFDQIDTDHLRRFLNYLQDEFIPDPKEPERRLAAKTVRNTYVTLSSATPDMTRPDRFLPEICCLKHLPSSKTSLK